jgi:hypothetical protein
VEHAASIFRVEKYGKQEAIMKQAASRAHGLQKCGIKQKQKRTGKPACSSGWFYLRTKVDK